MGYVTAKHHALNLLRNVGLTVALVIAIAGWIIPAVLLAAVLFTAPLWLASIMNALNHPRHR